MKTKIISLIIALFCLTPLVAFTAITLGAELTDANVTAMEKEIAAVTQKIEAAQRQLESIRSQQNEAWYEMSVLDGDF